MPGKKAGLASQQYCAQLVKLVMRHHEEATHHLRVSYCNVNGMREGSAIHVSSATTFPPSFVSVASRGEWLIRKILDVYFKFAVGGDKYRARILTLLDPAKDSFTTLLPYWKDPRHKITSSSVTS